MKRLDHKLALMTVSCACSAAAAQSIEWAIAQDGLWGDTASWISGNIPDAPSEHATLGLSGAYSAISSANYTYGSLTISNPLAELWIQSGTNGTQSGLENHGLVHVGGAGASGSPTLRFTSTALIAGSGELFLDAQTQSSDAQLLGSFPPITHADGHTIRGAGYIFGVLNNDGDIYADDPNGVGLEISGLLTQGPTGRLGARQGTLRILPSTTFQGGELYTEGDGVIELPAANVSLKNTLLSGHMNYPGGNGALKIESSLTNNGRIVVNSDENELGAKLELASSYALDGDGEIVLQAGSDEFSTELVIPRLSTLTIGEEQTIRGSGVINSRIDTFPQERSKIINHGMVIADNPDQPLYIRGDIYGPGIYFADDARLIILLRSNLENLVLDSSGAGVIEFEEFEYPLKSIENFGTVRGGLLQIADSLVNEGLIDLGPRDELNPGGARLTFESDVTIEGEGVIRLDQRPDQGHFSSLSIENGSTVVLEAGQTIEGSGTVRMVGNTSKLVNRGVIRANNPGVPLRLEGSYVGENGQFIADNAKIVFWGGTSQNLSDNLVLKTIGTGSYEIEYMVCDHIELHGNLEITDDSSSDWFIYGSLLNNGHITVHDHAALILVENAGIHGVGEIRNRGGFIGSNTSGKISLVDVGQTISGFGGFGAVQLKNDGQVKSDIAGEAMALTGTHIGGLGSYTADGGTFRLAGRYRDITLDSINDGYFVTTSDDSPIAESLVCNGDVHILQNSSINIEDFLEINGETTIRNSYELNQASIRFAEEGVLTGTGSVRLNPYTVLSGAVIIAETGHRGTIDSKKLVIGSGQLLGDLTIEGELKPDLPFRHIEIDNLTLGQNSTTTMQVRGLLPAQYDRITVINSGTLTPGGTLKIELENGYSPSLTNTWDLISTDGDQLNIDGWFETVELPIAPIGLAYRLHHDVDAIQLVLTVQADFDGNLALDIFDIFLFLEAFNAEDPIADMNSDGIFDVFDVFVLLNSFGV